MKRLFSFVFIALFFISAKADNYPVGANSLGMANSTVALSSLWSVYSNQAALAMLEGINVGIYYDTRFNMQEFATKSLAFAASTSHGSFGFNFTNFGFSAFSDNKIGASYSLKLGDKIAAGIQLDYFLIHQEAYYGNLSAISGEIGIIAMPVDNLYIAAHVFNPWRAKIASYQNERLPTIFRLGAAYQFNDAFKGSFEVQKDLQYSALFKAGMQYEIFKNFMLRGGLSFNKQNVYPAFGIGYTFNGVTLDIAFENTHLLGTKTGIGLSYKF